MSVADTSLIHFCARRVVGSLSFNFVVLTGGSLSSFRFFVVIRFILLFIDPTVWVLIIFTIRGNSVVIVAGVFSGMM